MNILHKSEVFHENNYKKYTKNEFVDLVKKIATEHGVNDLPEITFEKLDCLGQSFVLGKEIATIAFNRKLLNGKEYTIHDVEEVIKHELSHYIADIRYKTTCNHDALEEGCKRTWVFWI